MLVGNVSNAFAGIEVLSTILLVSAAALFVLLLCSILIFFKVRHSLISCLMGVSAAVLALGCAVLVYIRLEYVSGEVLADYSAEVVIQMGNKLEDVLQRSHEIATFEKWQGFWGVKKAPSRSVRSLSREVPEGAHESYFLWWPSARAEAQQVVLTVITEHAQATIPGLHSVRAEQNNDRVQEIIATFPSATSFDTFYQQYHDARDFLTSMGWEVPEQPAPSWQQLMQNYHIGEADRLGTVHARLYSEKHFGICARVLLRYFHESGLGNVELNMLKMGSQEELCE